MGAQLAFDIVGRDASVRAFRALDRNLGQVEGRLGRVGAVARSASRGLGIAAAAGGAAFAAVSAGAKRAVSDLAALGDAADRAQIEAGAFERLKAAFTLSGQDDAGLERAIITFQRMRSEAREGATEAVEAFERLGLSVEEVADRSLSTEDAIKRVSDGMARQSDETERLNAGMSLFGRGGAAFVSVLQQGSDALDQQFASAERLGLLYGGELIRNAQQLNIAFDSQAKILDTQVKRAFVQVAPAITAIGENFIAILPAIASFTQHIVAGTNELLALLGLAQRPLEVQLAANIDDLRDVQDRLSQMAGVGQDVIEPSIISRVLGGPDTPLPNPFFVQLQEQEAELIAANRRLSEEIETRNGLLTDFPTRDVPDLPVPSLGSGKGGGGKAKLSEEAREADKAAAAFKALAESVASKVQATREELALAPFEGEARDKAALAIETQRLQTEALTAAKAAGGKVAEDEIRLVAQSIDLYGQLARQRIEDAAALETQRDAAEQAAREMSELGSAITDPIRQALADGKLDFEEFSDAVAQIAQNLQARLVERLFEPLEEHLVNALSGLGKLGSGGGDGGGGGLFGFLGNVLGGFLGGSAAPTSAPVPVPRPNALGNAFSAGRVTAFAAGGVVNRPTLFPMANGAGLMGEAGPEAILPLERGAGGRLGVRAQVSGGGGAAPISMGDTIINITEPGASREEIAAEIAAHRDAMLAYFERQHRLRGNLFSDAA